MNKDSHLIFEAMQRKWKLTSMHPAEATEKFGKEHVKVTPHGLRNGRDMVEVNVSVDDKGYDAAENAENEESNIHMVAAAHLKPGDVLSHFKNTVLQVDAVAERLIKGKVRITYKDIRGVTHKVDWNKSTKISVDKASQENGEEDVHPYHGPLTDLGGGYYWAAEDEQDTDDQWYNFFLLKKTHAERSLYKNIRSFIKIRDYDDDLVSDDSSRIKAWLKKNNVIDISSEDEEGDLMRHMKEKGMVDKKATEDTGKYGRTKEEQERCADEDEQRRLDPACWKGYHKSGTKMKGGVRVNNCVKSS